jgi:hypothetical protein
MEALNSPETAVLTIATRRNIPEDAILHTCLLFIPEDGDIYSSETRLASQKVEPLYMLNVQQVV